MTDKSCKCLVDVKIDKLLQYPSRTPDLYEAKIAPLVEKTMNGFNSTIFAWVRNGFLVRRQLTTSADMDKLDPVNRTLWSVRENTIQPKMLT